MEDRSNENNKKIDAIALAVFFFGLLATSAVLADDADSEGWQLSKKMVEPTTEGGPKRNLLASD